MSVPPCAGQWRLFDSTDPADHMLARGICARCPIIDACRDELEAVRNDAVVARYGPVGTWAGVLLTGPRNKARIAAEDAHWGDDGARQAHQRYNAGARDPLTSEGERVYQRRRVRANREQRQAS